jgi:hypothetical protein
MQGMSSRSFEVRPASGVGVTGDKTSNTNAVPAIKKIAIARVANRAGIPEL